MRLNPFNGRAGDDPERIQPKKGLFLRDMVMAPYGPGRPSVKTAEPRWKFRWPRRSSRTGPEASASY